VPINQVILIWKKMSEQFQGMSLDIHFSMIKKADDPILMI
jgi:hypothetical protein